MKQLPPLSTQPFDLILSQIDLPPWTSSTDPQELIDYIIHIAVSHIPKLEVLPRPGYRYYTMGRRYFVQGGAIEVIVKASRDPDGPEQQDQVDEAEALGLCSTQFAALTTIALCIY